MKHHGKNVLNCMETSFISIMNTNHLSRRLRVLPLLLAALFMAACSESLNIDPLDHAAPEVTGFSPTTGQIGTVVKIEGSHLQEVDSIKIGGYNADVTRVNPNLVLATITKENVSGKIEVFNPYGSTTYEDGEFTVEYLRPSVTDYPTSADVFSTANIKGENLDLVNAIQIGDVTISSSEFEQQSEDMIEFTVPYYDSDEAVSIILKYNYGPEPAELVLPEKFTLNVLKPTVSSYTTKSYAGGTLEMQGVNLKVVEKVLVDGTELSFYSQSDSSIVCYLPADQATNSAANIELVYYNGNVTKSIGTMNIVTTATHIWKNVVLKATYQNFFSGITGQYYTIDEFTANSDKIHLAVSGHNSNEWLQIESLNANSNFSGTDVKKSGWPMRFRKLKESNEVDKKYIDMVNNEDFVTEALSLSQATADGLSTSPKKQVIRYKFPGGKWTGTGNNDAETYNTTNDEGIYKGGVNLVMLLDSSGNVVNVGLVQLVDIVMGSSYSTSQMVVNFYFPK